MKIGIVESSWLLSKQIDKPLGDAQKSYQLFIFCGAYFVENEKLTAL
jgi:hypothetical protein